MKERIKQFIDAVLKEYGLNRRNFRLNVRTGYFRRYEITNGVHSFEIGNGYCYFYDSGADMPTRTLDLMK